MVRADPIGTEHVPRGWGPARGLGCERPGSCQLRPLRRGAGADPGVAAGCGRDCPGIAPARARGDARLRRRRGRRCDVPGACAQGRRGRRRRSGAGLPRRQTAHRCLQPHRPRRRSAGPGPSGGARRDVGRACRAGSGGTRCGSGGRGYAFRRLPGVDGQRGVSRHARARWHGRRGRDPRDHGRAVRLAARKPDPGRLR